MKKRLILLGILTGISLMATCDSPPPEEDLFQRMEIGFAKPYDKDISGLEKLVRLINLAEIYVHAAFYHFEELEVAEALIQARDRGVEVQVVGDADSADEAGFIAIQKSGIPLTLGDGELYYLPDPNLDTIHREGEKNRMTHNFVVIDDRFVWNSTKGIVDLKKNTSYYTYFLIQSQEIAEDFDDEFNQLFGGVFSTTLDVYNGPLKSITDGRSHYIIKDIDLEIYFGPQERLVKQVIDEVYAAKSSIYFMTDHFTDDFLAKALRYKEENGFSVKGILEDSFIGEPEGKKKRFKEQGSDVRKDSPETKIDQSVFIMDYEKARDGIHYPVKIMVISHSLWNTYSYTRSGSPIESDSFCDGNMLVINNYGLSENSIFEKFVSIFNEVYQKGSDL